MKFPLIWRILAPTLAVSTLLLAVGLTAAVYGYRWNDQVSRALDHRVAVVLISQELVTTIRDARHALSRFEATHDDAYRTQAKESLATARSLAEKLTALKIMDDAAALAMIHKSIASFETQVDRITEADSGELRDAINLAALVEAQALLDRRQAAVSEESRQNRLNAGRIGTSLAILGFSGAGAGLLAGFGVARGITRSIQQLGGSVHSVAETIFQDGESVVARPVGLPELLATMGDIRQKTVGIMDELEQSREKATRSDQLAAVGQLAAGLAHELRNPLTTVKLLIDGAVERQTPLQSAELLVLQDEVAHLEQMTQSFLDFARPPKLIRKAVAIGQVADQCVELVRRRCEMLGIQLSCHVEPITVVGDPQQLRQVILNILLNAIDAQPSGGQIEVRMRKDPAADSCRIEIADAGSGVPADEWERIFDPFISTKETGMGLGLAVSRRIVRSHGGEISIANRVGGGTVFQIQLPLSAISAEVPRV